MICEGEGDFETLVRRPYLTRQFGTDVVISVIDKALRKTGGRYREAFRLLKIPDPEYSVMMQFLKRHRCYLDFRLYRGKAN
jgi:hypothetical protein